MACIKELIANGSLMTHIIDAYCRNLEKLRISSTESHHRIVGGNYFTREYGDEKDSVKFELKYSMFRDSICSFLRARILEYINVVPHYSVVWHSFIILELLVIYSLTHSLTHSLDCRHSIKIAISMMQKPARKYTSNNSMCSINRHMLYMTSLHITKFIYIGNPGSH